MEIESLKIFSSCENKENASNGPICFTTKPSITKIHFLASDPDSCAVHPLQHP